MIRPRTLVVYMLAGLSGVALLHTSQSVQRAQEEKAALENEIAREEERIRMLKAEWVHLNRPERLEALADEFLDLVPPAPDHIVEEDIFAHPPAAMPEARDVNFPASPAEKVAPPIPKARPPAIEARASTAPAPVPEAPAPPEQTQTQTLPPSRESAPKKSFDALLGELGANQNGEGTP